MKKSKFFDLLVVLLIVVAAAWLTVQFNWKGFYSIVAYFIVPAVYLCFREEKNYKKILAGTFIFGGLGGLPFDLLAQVNNIWTTSYSRFVFPQKIYGPTSIDYATFYFAFVFFITVFYEHFLDDEKKKTISKNLPYALAFFIFAFALISVIYVFNPRLLIMPYEYLILGFVATVPISGYMLWRKPRLAPKMIKVGIFSFFVTLTAEITAMMTGQWEWPGQYIATISTFGLVFPVEEFIFWIFLGAPAIVAYYEFSADDEK